MTPAPPALLQVHASEDEITLYWIEGTTIVRRWTEGEDSLPPSVATIIGDLRLVYEAAVEAAAAGRHVEG